MIMMEIRFPVITISKGTIGIFHDVSKLTLCSAFALKRGHFNGLKIFDSALQCFTVKSAKKLNNVGPFWGFDLFLNQWIRVEFEFRAKPTIFTLKELQNLILKMNHGGHVLSGADPDFANEIIERISNAGSFDDIIQALIQCGY